MYTLTYFYIPYSTPTHPTPITHCDGEVWVFSDEKISSRLFFINWVALFVFLSLLCSQLPHTSKEVLPLRPGPVPNGTQPVNIVRPLRPVPFPQGGPREPKVVRPSLPATKPPVAPPKSPSQQRLSPPKKPLPLNPTRSPLVRPCMSLEVGFRKSEA